MDNFDKNKILESTSKVVERKKKNARKVSELEFFCYICETAYTISRKGDDGKMEVPQQVCPHVTLKRIGMI